MLLALGLLAVSASASGIYRLTTVLQYNPFAPAGANTSGNFSGPIPTDGTAVIDDAGNVTANGIQFSWFDRYGGVRYVDGVWTTAVGGSFITHSETCLGASSAGTPYCDSDLNSALNGLWGTNIANGGGVSAPCSGGVGLGPNIGTPSYQVFASYLIPAGACDQVSILESQGANLQIVEQSQSGFAGLPSGYIFNFTAVPAPASGLLAVTTLLPLIRLWFRRRRRGW